MLLNQAQAQAVYTAMCHLDNVGARINVAFRGRHELRVFELPTGRVHVVVMDDSNVCMSEHYDSQQEFALAYGQ